MRSYINEIRSLCQCFFHHAILKSYNNHNDAKTIILQSYYLFSEIQPLNINDDTLQVYKTSWEKSNNLNSLSIINNPLNNEILWILFQWWEFWTNVINFNWTINWIIVHGDVMLWEERAAFDESQQLPVPNPGWR